MPLPPLPPPPLYVPFVCGTPPYAPVTTYYTHHSDGGFSTLHGPIIHLTRQQVSRGRVRNDVDGFGGRCVARRRTLGPSDMSGCNPLLSCLPQLRRQESFTLVRVVDPSLKSDSVNNTLLCTACECQDDDRPSLKACPDCDEYFCDVECLRRTSCPHLECSVDRVLADAEAICGIGCQCRCCKARWPPLCDDCEAIPCYCQRKSGNERSRWRAKYGKLPLAIYIQG